MRRWTFSIISLKSENRCFPDLTHSKSNLPIDLCSLQLLENCTAKIQDTRRYTKLIKGQKSIEMSITIDVL